MEAFRDVVHRLARAGIAPEAVTAAIASFPDVAPWVAGDPGRLTWIEGEVQREWPPELAPDATSPPMRPARRPARPALAVTR